MSKPVFDQPYGLRYKGVYQYSDYVEGREGTCPFVKNADGEYENEATVSMEAAVDEAAAAETDEETVEEPEEAETDADEPEEPEEDSGEDESDK